MKRWTARDPQTGATVSPDGLNEEFRSSQSSITTLDRTQAPELLVDNINAEDGCFARVWSDRLLNTDGEQYAKGDQNTPVNMWACVTYQDATSGWTNAAGTRTFTGFKGGSLYGEWSGNGFVFPSFAATAGNPQPGDPKYLNVRLLVNGVVFAERRGVSQHDHFRLFGVGRFPQGDLSVSFQFKVTESAADEPINTSAGTPLQQAHLYSMRYFFIGRWR